MKDILLFDFSRVLVFAYQDTESLNAHHNKLASEVAHYKVLDHFYLNTELLDYLRNLQSHCTCYLFSDGRLHTLSEIAKQLDGVFDSIFTPATIGYNKNDPRAYEKISKIIGCDVARMVFVDDKAANVAAATSAGVLGIRYVSNEATIKVLAEILG